MKTVGLVLLALLAATALAAAQPSSEEATQVANDTVADGKSALDSTLDGVQDAGSAVGDAIQDTGQGIGNAASSVGAFFSDVAGALASGVAVTADLAAASSLAIATGLATTTASAGAAVTDGLAAIGRAMPDAARAVGSALAAVGSAVADLVAAYYGAVFGLRPGWMPAPAFTAIVAAGSATGAAAGAWGLGSLLRKAGLLGGLAGVAGFSRIDDDEVLRNPMRAQVFQVIQQNPGIHASELARKAGAGWGTIVHHLDRLEKAKLVAVRKVNNQKCFFEIGGKVSRLDMEVASAVRGPTAAQIAGFVAAHPMTSQKELAAAIGISPALTSFHVKKLASLGALDKVRRGKETVLTITDAMRRVLTQESAQQPVSIAPGIMA